MSTQELRQLEQSLNSNDTLFNAIMTALEEQEPEQGYLPYITLTPAPRPATVLIFHDFDNNQLVDAILNYANVIFTGHTLVIPADSFTDLPPAIQNHLQTSYEVVEA